ncbi:MULTISPECIES: hypothetical protein [unclassified Sphingomonas]|jgi:hypothetical protein|uniref:hypothetical protein n=1 Tax=Sphingomonas TaxID=13687 RepID=UPI00095A95F2|nr:MULTISPECIES: hypothetical protein [unclassified Sphingomonas]MBN8810277.1 hypothetical protein [Sphingomonas sp.]OJY50830.1 MAG: hypothetical protein BGP17_20770 [Sphingomonas sp. 67-41]
MHRAFLLLAGLFWTLLFALAIFAWWRNGAFHPDLFYLLGIPVGMASITMLVGRFAIRSHAGAGILLAATGLAAFATLLWGSVWGADV